MRMSPNGVPRSVSPSLISVACGTQVRAATGNRTVEADRSLPDRLKGRPWTGGVRTAVHIIHVLSDIDDRYGGPQVVVPSLARELARRGLSTEILSVQTLPEERNRIVEESGLEARAYPRRLPGPAYYAPGLGAGLRERLARTPGPRIVHLHSLWRYPGYVALRESRRAGVPLVTTLHSNLYAASLRRSAWRKRLARWLFADRLLARSACLHATEPGEVEAVRELGLATPVALIPNAVDAARFAVAMPAAAARAELGVPVQRRYVLFLSRLHGRKGIDRLVEAWGRLAPRFPDWGLLLGGPEDDPALMERLRGSLPGGFAAHRIHELGMLRDAAVVAAYKAADIFTLPSEFENYGMVIAEALASGLPVVTTRGTPWQAIAEVGAGAWIEPTSAALEDALGRCMALPPDALGEMGRRGRRLVAGLDWAEAAAKLHAVYDWVWADSRRHGATLVPSDLQSFVHPAPAKLSLAA
jgi:glycosyltransferase involved in cell wall biosynthesis